MSQEPAKLKTKNLSASAHEDYAKYTLLAFLIAPAAFILGIILLGKDDKLDKKLGEHLLAVSILFGMVWSAVYFFYLSKYFMTPVLVPLQ